MEAVEPNHSARTDALICAILFLLLCALDLFLQLGVWHRPLFTDDAFYYIVLARHVVQDHRSSFDGFTLTNGYHPLWAVVMSLQYKFLGQSLLLTRWIEYLLGLGTLLTTLPVVQLPNRAQKMIFTLGLFWVLTTFAFKGMETSLFACCFGLMTYFSRATLRGENDGSVKGAIVNGLLGAAAIAARIDAAVFVLPQIFFSTKTLPRKILAIGIAAAILGLYALLNLHYFGVLFPISGQVKSLGGLQLNHLLIRQLLKASEVEINSFYLPLFLFLISPFILRSTRNVTLRHVLLAFMVGFPIFFLRLFFLSSWRLWFWYGYPLLFAYIGCVPSLLMMAEKQLERFFSPRQILVAANVFVFLVLSYFARNAFHHHKTYPAGYFAINHEAIDQYGKTLNGARVAMGDRSGSFAYEYAGGVNQLEGIMNDKDYFEALNKKGDIRETLCKRDVHFVISYEKDLGSYQTFQVATIRPDLSQYAAPGIEVRREDEAARVADLSELSAASSGYKNVYLYIWRLHCS